MLAWRCVYRPLCTTCIGVAQARSLSPAIIFIDEIDAVGRTRGGAQGNDERDQTLNQMLSEMDGFQNSSQVTVMAATNRQAVPALSATRLVQRGIMSLLCGGVLPETPLQTRLPGDSILAADVLI